MLQIHIQPTNQTLILKDVLLIGNDKQDGLFLEGLQNTNYQAILAYERETKSCKLQVLTKSPPTFVNQIIIEDQAIIKIGDEISIGQQIFITISTAQEIENSHNSVEETAIIPTTTSSLSVDSNRVGCDHCFKTIDNINSRKGVVEAMVDDKGRYYHPHCVAKLDNTIAIRDTILSVPTSLPSQKLIPVAINAITSNSMNDLPLGISDNRVIIDNLKAFDIAIKNNNHHPITLDTTTGTPWLHMEIPLENYKDGQVFLPAQESINLTFRPFFVRPSHQKHHLLLTGKKGVIIYSNGSDILTWSTGVILFILLFHFHSAFGELTLIFDNFSQLINTQPFTIFGNLLWIYIKFSLFIAFTFLVSPTTILKTLQTISHQINKLPLLNRITQKIIYKINWWLLLPEQLSYTSPNISHLSRVALGIGFLTSMFVIPLICLILFSAIVTSTTSLLSLAYFIIVIVLLYQFNQSYKLIESINLQRGYDFIKQFFDSLGSN